MKVTKAGTGPSQEMTGGIFTGTIKMMPLVNAETGSKQLKSALVYFPKGVRNHFHHHTHEQILFITKCKGIVATKEKEYTVEPGDIIHIPAGEEHWHGATEDTYFEHLYIVPLESKTTY